MKHITLAAALCALPTLALAQNTDAKKTRYIDSTFAAMDTNRDGSVDKQEYATYQQARFDTQADTVESAFKEMDSDSDGYISKAEAEVVPEIARYFDALDTDKDGRLSLREMQQAMVAAQTLDAADK